MTTVNIDMSNTKECHSTYSIGDFLLVDNELAIISQVDVNKVCILTILDSNRYKDPIYVENLQSISFETIKRMAGGEAYEVIPVKSVNIEVEV